MENIKEKEKLWKIGDKVKYDLYRFDNDKKGVDFLFESICQIRVTDGQFNSINTRCPEGFSHATEEEIQKYFN